MQHLQLQRTLNFTTDDLRANRDGRISEAQYKKYEPPKYSKTVLIVVFGHALVIGGLLGAIAIITGEAAMWIVLGIVLAMGLLPFLLMHNEGNINPTLRGDATNGVVKKACGIVILTPKTRRNKTTYVELYIDGINLNISDKQSSAFIHEEVYCIYYLPLSRTLLSAEPYLE